MGETGEGQLRALGEENMQSKRRHAEIAGAGMAGLTAAAALAQRGWSVRVHERTPAMRIVGSGLSMFENALRVMRAIGAEEDATRGAREGFERETRDARGQTTSHLRYATRMFEITREQVVRALAMAAERSGVEIVTGSMAVDVDPRGVLVLEDGKRCTADLVIAADGVNSRLRDALGIPTKRRWLKDGAIRTMTPRLHDELVHPDAKKNIEYWSGQRRILVAPCSDTELYVALTALDSDEGAKRIPLDHELWIRSFPCLESVIRRLTGDARWDRFQTVKMARWSKGHVAVLGDAANAMAPNLGQGGACAMMNGLGLAVTLDAVADIPTALEAWETKERPITDHTQDYSTFYSELTTWPETMRSLAFWLISRSTLLRGRHLKTARHIPTGTEQLESRAVTA